MLFTNPALKNLRTAKVLQISQINQIYVEKV